MKLDQIATQAHAGQVDKAGRPYMEHVHAVADSVGDEVKPVALFHDVLEDTHVTPEELKAALVGPRMMKPEQAQHVIDAVKLLTRDPSQTYEQYVERVAAAPGSAGELRARSSAPTCGTTSDA